MILEGKFVSSPKTSPSQIIAKIARPFFTTSRALYGFQPPSRWAGLRCFSSNSSVWHLEDFPKSFDCDTSSVFLHCVEDLRTIFSYQLCRRDKPCFLCWSHLNHRSWLPSGRKHEWRYQELWKTEFKELGCMTENAWEGAHPNHS